MSNLPGWIEAEKRCLNPICRSKDLMLEALEISWKALEWAKDFRIEYRDEHIEYPIQDAMRRIEELGK